ncbi:MAG: hypothetical protein ACXWKO_04350, partial [Phenylobacterium sp.]
RSAGRPVVLALALLTAACATTAGPKAPGAAPPRQPAQAPRGRSGDMVSGEESGLGITGADTPPALKIVAAKPYAVPPAVDCAALDREIASLDALLGPDVDILADPKAGAGLEDRAGHAFGSALRGAIPYRWALRWLTQAGDMDKQLRQAVIAGAARRGFLTGMRLAMVCPAPVPPPPAPASETIPPKSPPHS